MRFILCFIIFFSCFTNSVLAGINTDSVNIKNDNYTYSSVIFGFDFSNNATTDSRLNNLTNQSSYYPYISYYAKHGLLLNAGVNVIGNSDSSLTKTTYSYDFLMGYDFSIGKNITISPSYTFYLYDKNTMLLNKLYSHNTDVSVSFELGNFNSVLSTGYKWGKIGDWNSTIKAGYSISFGKIFSKTDLISIQPSVSLGFSNPNYYTKLFSFLNNYIEANPNAGLGRLVYDIFHISDQNPEVIELRRILRENHDLVYMIRDYLPSGIPLSEILNSNNKFIFTNLGFTIPVSYLTGNFTISSSFSAYRTFNQPVYLENKWYYYISAGISYAINW